MNGHWVVIILGFVLILAGFKMRTYFTKNLSDFDEKPEKLFGFSMMFVVGGFLAIILGLIFLIDSFN